MPYRWATPFDWLEWATTFPREKISTEELLIIIRENVDPDAIQDHFQSEMESDGYFMSNYQED